MATTSRPITELAIGIRDTSGAVVASGKARFYNPGTLVAATVYTDDSCSTALTQPATLNAGGQYKYLYTLEPVRMIVKDSTETTTYYDGIVNLNRHDSVYVTHASWNSGTETTLETILGTLATSLGSGGTYKESSTAPARNYVDVIGDLCVNVKDYGATGDGSTDDTTAIQNACNRVETRGGGWVYFPKGTFKITSAITIDTAGVKICGAGRGVAVIKNFGTTTNSLTITLGGAADAKIVIRDISFTCNTTSSGKAIESTNGDGVAVYNVATALHRTGVDFSAVSGCIVRDCLVESTDDNAAAVGITVGARGRVGGCEVSSSTDNGSGIVLGADAVAESECYVTNFATGILASGARCKVRDSHVTGATTGVTVSGAAGQATGNFVTSCTTGITVSGTLGARASENSVTSCTTGINLTGANAIANYNYVTGGTTGISVGAIASAQVIGNNLTSNTTDISINSSATLLVEHSNTYTTVTAIGLGHKWKADRQDVISVNRTTSATATETFTPSIAYAMNVYVNTGGAGTTTIGATSTTGLVDGQLMWLVLAKDSGSNQTETYDSQYIAFNGGTVTAGESTVRLFRWRAATSKWLQIAADINQPSGAASW